MLDGGTLSYTGPAASINRWLHRRGHQQRRGYRYRGEPDLERGDHGGPGQRSSPRAGPAQLDYATAGTSTLSDALGYTVDQGTVLFNGTGTNNIAGTFAIGTAGKS